jgi:hypothetical protein
MAFFVKNIQISGDLIKHQYNGVDINTLATNIDFLMLKEGYKLVSGQKGNGEYEKGNRVLRILFGAFVKYFKYTIKLKELEDKSIELLFIKTSSGMSGGLIGMNQVKNELKRLAQVLSTI